VRPEIPISKPSWEEKFFIQEKGPFSKKNCGRGSENESGRMCVGVNKPLSVFLEKRSEKKRISKRITKQQRSPTR